MCFDFPNFVSVSQVFEQVFAELFLKHECPVQVGPTTFKFLDDYFLKYNFSIMSFKRTLTFVLLDHFSKTVSTS